MLAIQSLQERHQQLIRKPNQSTESLSVLFQRYRDPVLTAEHIPPIWRYDFTCDHTPYLIERLGINAVFNAGAIKVGDRFYLIARVEGVDRKSFFAVAESKTGIDQFQFFEFPAIIPELDSTETNVYDMRLTQHEDGWIYGVFCVEYKDPQAPASDTSSAIARAGIVRTRDLLRWERLPNLKTSSPQHRNVVLHPEFVNGQYGFYTRPQDGFIETGSGGGIGWGVAKDIEHPQLTEEMIIDPRLYHTIKESKNGLGPAPIKTESGWLQMAHGVRSTAAGLRYVLYLFMTDLKEPWKVIHMPGGYFMAPRGAERVGDVSNVLFCNGWILDGDMVYIYYGSSDTRVHVATSRLDTLIDYVMHTPSDPGTTFQCVQQRIETINRNKDYMKNKS